MPPTTLIHHRGVWTLDSKVPTDWPELVHRHGGGFFHTPLGLRAGAPDGEPLFARFYQDNRVVGIAAGVRVPCRLSGFFKHLYFPTWPAFADPGLAQTGMTRLAGALRESSVAEVRWDSFDTELGGSRSARPSRWEYVLELQGMAERADWLLTPELLKGIQQGDRAGWGVGELQGQAAEAALARVTGGVGPRVGGAGIGGRGVPSVVTVPFPPSRYWSVTTYAVTHDGELLAAALVGRTGGRAYCLAGGATHVGQLQGAYAWLQSRLIGRFTNEGCTRYNLGHAPLSAAQDNDPAHAIHRFRCGLGALPIACGGEIWVLLAAHIRSHQLFGAAAGAAT